MRECLCLQREGERPALHCCDGDMRIKVSFGVLGERADEGVGLVGLFEWEGVIGLNWALRCLALFGIGVGMGFGGNRGCLSL